MANPDPPTDPPEMTRRGFLASGTAAVAGLSALAAALSPLRQLDPDDLPTAEEFLQKHYKEMTPEERGKVLERIRKEVERRHKVTPTVTDPPPLDGVEFVYGLNISRCIGCRKCVHACVKENNQSRSPEIQYIRVLEMEKGSIDVETANPHYDSAQVPRPDK